MLLLTLILLSLAGCSKKSDIKDQLRGYDANGLFSFMKEHYTDHKSDTAIIASNILIEEYPLFSEVHDVYIMRIYSHYINFRFVDAVATAHTFLNLYPASPQVPYVLYMIGMSHYQQLLTPYTDQDVVLETLESFVLLNSLYPNSPFIYDVNSKLKYIKNMLAANEMMVGREYMKKHKMISAIERFRVIITNYSDTTFIDEALYRITIAYYNLGVVNQYQIYAALLMKNFPHSQWTCKLKDIKHLIK